jgi:hypothetical protein
MCIATTTATAESPVDSKKMITMKRVLYTSPLPPPPTLACTLTAPTPDDTPKVDGDGLRLLQPAHLRPDSSLYAASAADSNLHASAADSSLHASGADISRPHHNAFGRHQLLLPACRQCFRTELLNLVSECLNIQSMYCSSPP